MGADLNSTVHTVLAANFPTLDMSHPSVQRVVPLCRLKRLAREATLFSTGDAAPGLCAVVEGELAMRQCGFDGQLNVLELVTPARLFGLAALASDSPCGYEAVALQPSRVLVIQTVNEWLREQAKAGHLQACYGGVRVRPANLKSPAPPRYRP